MIMRLQKIGKFLRALWHGQSGGDRRTLHAFLETRSAFLTQKTLTEYAQARANMSFSALLTEKGFQEAFEKARWQAFPHCFAMVGETVMGHLRTGQGLEAATAAAQVEGWEATLLRDYPEDARAQALALLIHDLARARLAAPLPPHGIVALRARHVFDALPFHKSVKSHDLEMFQNTLAFHLTAILAELQENQWAS
jgi:hypothetical protein